MNDHQDGWCECHEHEIQIPWRNFRLKMGVRVLIEKVVDLGQKGGRGMLGVRESGEMVSVRGR